MTEETVEGGMSSTKKIVNWKLNNFAHMFIHDDALVKQQKMTFEVTNSEGVISKWMMSLDFKEDVREQNSQLPSTNGSRSPEYLSIVMCLVSTSNKASLLNAKIDLKFEGQIGSIFLIELGGVISNKYKVGNNKIWLIKAIDRNTDIGYLLSTEGTMLVKVEMTIFDVLGQTPKGKEVEAGLVSEQKEFSYRLISSLENNKSHSDVRIVSKDEKKFFAHRWILSGASDVFEAMFRANMTETSSGVVKLNDVSGSAVKILLHFIYTGKMAEDWKKPGIVEEVIYVADKYQIAKMKEYIDVMMGEVCTIENAATLLQLVNSTGLKRASSDIVKFIRENTKDCEGMLMMLNNYSKGFQSSNSSVTVSNANTSTDATSSKLSKPSSAKRRRFNIL